MNPLSRIPENVRLALYALYALAGPVLIYTASRGWTGESEYQLYVGIGTALTLTAASNVSTGPTVNAAKVAVVEGPAEAEYVGEHRAFAAAQRCPVDEIGPRPGGYFSGV